MRIATWNVNSVRARLPVLLPWLQTNAPDVVCLQETKCRDEAFPREEIEDLGYTVATHGQKTYSGVAILSKLGLEDVVRGLPDDGPDADRRVIGATVAGCMILSLYAVNGRAVGTESYAYKLEWFARVRDFLRGHYPLGSDAGHERVVVCGDFNVTFDDRDVWDPKLWRERILCSTPERRALRELLDCGLFDPLRKFTDSSGFYTWWDFRTRGFERNRGLRIDHFLLSRPALDACVGLEVDLAPRGGEKPSDHAPVIATFS